MFGLIFVNLGPLKILPKINPPISDATQANSKIRSMIFNPGKLENKKNNEESEENIAKTEKQLCALIIIINELLTDYSNGKCNLDGSLNSLRW